MEIFLFLLCISFLLPVQSGDTDRYSYCEGCLTAAQEIEKAMKQTSAESRQTVVENLLSGGVCEKLLSNKHDHHTNDKLLSSCSHLLESNYDRFHAALVDKEPKNLDIVLCYEQSTACVGVKRQSFEDSKTPFEEGDIAALLQENKENVRFAKPVHSGSPLRSRDEL